ncbi:MAG TPA: hypothetical protein ENI87_01565 [bacterium]|nr:hypothetical protein [bacterium]
MLHPRQFVRLAAFLLAGVLAAQRPVVTVGGPPPNFSDLPAAIAAAAPGSVVEVRPGVYTGFATNKPLRVVLYGAIVQPAAGASYTIEVHDLADPDGFTLIGKNGATLATGPLGAMRVANTPVKVAIESMTMLAGPFQAGLDVRNTGVVHVSRSILVGWPGLQAQFCDLVSCENVIGNPYGVGAVVADSLFESSRSIFIGTAQPALRLVSTDARLASDGTGGMFVTGAVSVPVAAVEALDGSLWWDPSRFLLFPGGGGAALSSAATLVVPIEVPMLNAGPAEPGGVASARLTIAQPSIAMIAMSFLQSTPQVLGPVSIYLDPALYVTAAAGIADPAGLFVQYPIPNDPTLRGEIYAFQGATFNIHGVPRFSAPALWCIE